MITQTGYSAHPHSVCGTSAARPGSLLDFLDDTCPKKFFFILTLIYLKLNLLLYREKTETHAEKRSPGSG